MSELVSKKELMEEIKKARPAITFAEYGEDTCDSFLRKSEVLDIIYKAPVKETIDFDKVKREVMKLYRYPSRFFLSELDNSQVDGYNEAIGDVLHILFVLCNKDETNRGAVPK